MSSSTKILIVDDESIGLQLLEAILVPEGYNLFYGKDGEEALKVAIEELPDIILLDVMMPKMDGFEVCKKLHENETTAHIPVYLITALDDRDSRLRGIDAGAYDYISKPFDRIEILAKIKNITNQIKIQKKNLPAKDDSLKSLHYNRLNIDLLPALVNTILESDTDSEQFQAYHSKVNSESSHACIRKKSGTGQYTLLISNKLEGSNAIVSNCIFKTILFNNIEVYNKQLKKIIHQSYLDLNKIVKNNKITTLENAGFSVLIVFQNQDNNEVIATGLNQHIYVLENDSLLNQNQNPSYHSYYLQGNQELKYEEAKGILVFSPTVYEKINQKELLIVLNDMQKHSNHIDPGQLVKDKLGTIPDLILIKLTF